MSVINTNYLALVSQNNLTKSQNALGTAIERLSSGLRINSAKDDAAGQAIANRFTANVKGLTQASRNANDGISIAQTTEGALNEINNNLQRIRELSVQAANGSNSETDLKSIQDEISQRLDEIDRVSEQTQFNGKSVLSSKAESLKVQVGSQDSEVISINLRAINRETLGLSNLNMENQFVSKNAAGESNFTPFTGTLNGLGNVTSIPNTVTSAESAQWASFNTATKTFPGFPGGYDGLAVHASTNELYAFKISGGGTSTFYSATFDPDNGTIVVGASDGAVTNANTTQNPGAVFDPGIAGHGGYVALANVSTNMISTTDPTIDGFYLQNSAGGAATLWAEIDGSYYEVAVTFTSGVPTLSIDFATGESAATWTPAPSLTSDTYLAAFGTAGVSLDYTAAATTIGAAASAMTYVKNEAGDEFVRVQAGTGSTATYTYYAASYNATTGLITAASTATNTAPDMAGVNALLGASDTTLVQYAGKEGYFVQQGTGENAKYYAADMTSAGTVTLTRADGQAATNAAQAAEAEIMVDPLSALDKALQNVDSLRSELGAVQNRFQSTIANLSNTINNLSAARSRIEDADYAVEVSNMTRAQILQQAGTSVLAQANQVPQTVLSLLR